MTLDLQISDDKRKSETSDISANSQTSDTIRLESFSSDEMENEMLNKVSDSKLSSVKGLSSLENKTRESEIFDIPANLQDVDATQLNLLSNHNAENKMSDNLDNSKKFSIEQMKPRITVLGVGGGGGNAVNNMISAGLEGVDFIVANTDAQALASTKAEKKIQLGVNTTLGLGAGALPEMGAEAAKEDLENIIEHISKSHMLFLTAGMGGGTGTGAAPVIAKAAREKGILTVGIVTKPFDFEGPRRMKTAEKGIETLESCVDTLIVIPNQNLFHISNEKTTFPEAFSLADQVLYAGVASITDLMVKEGMINLDFADVRTVMSEMGRAMMGTGEASGENRATQAAEAAIANPLLDETSMKGAKGLLISITGGEDMTLFEVDEAAKKVREEVDRDANVIFGAIYDESLNGCLRVSVLATGLSKSGSDLHKQPLDYDKTNLVVAEKSQSSKDSGKLSSQKTEITSSLQNFSVEHHYDIENQAEKEGFRQAKKEISGDNNIPKTIKKSLFQKETSFNENNDSLSLFQTSFSFIKENKNSEKNLEIVNDKVDELNLESMSKKDALGDSFLAKKEDLKAEIFMRFSENNSSNSVQNSLESQRDILDFNDTDDKREFKETKGFWETVKDNVNHLINPRHKERHDESIFRLEPDPKRPSQREMLEQLEDSFKSINQEIPDDSLALKREKNRKSRQRLEEENFGIPDFLKRNYK